MYNIYLAGQMAPDPRTVAWRQELTVLLEQHAVDYEIVDPSENEAFTKNEGGVKAIENASRSWKGPLIVPKDRRHVEMADIIVANLNHFDTDKIIWGTAFELAWAFDDPSKIVMLIGFPDSPYIKHPFTEATSDGLFGSVEEVAEAIRWITNG